MYARKLRYDEKFIITRHRTGLSAVCPADVAYSLPLASPARELQEQLQAYLSRQSAIISSAASEKYSPGASLTIIAGSSLALWLGIAAVIVSIY